jgi:apolipoprotein N-acyltransferase
MIAVRLLLVALLIVVAALGLAWVLTGQRKYLGWIGRVLRFALVFSLVAALFYMGERILLR